jgi:hypothetical protein
LIRAAALAACERITRDTSNGWRVTLDSDTRSVAGMCDIPNVILKKIRACDTFLGDLTLVGSAAAKPAKLFPNANVVFELGYAARHLSFKALIGVLNEAYGVFADRVFERAFHGFNLLPAVVTSIQLRRRPKMDYDHPFEVIQSAGLNPSPDGDVIAWPGRFSMTELDLGGHLIHAYGATTTRSSRWSRSASS